MATSEQQQASHKKLLEALGALKSIDPESLVRADVLGKDLSFERGLPVFRQTLELFKDLSECNLESLPFETLEQLGAQANDALSLFKQIQNFSIQQNPQNPVQARDSLIVTLRDRWHQYFSVVTPLISYAVRRGTDFDALEREARGTIALQKQLATDFRAERDKVLAEMTGALERVRQAAAEAGVSQHAIYFNTEAEYHKTQAHIWLGVTGAFGLAIVVYALYSLNPQIHDLSALSAALAIQHIVPRLVVIFVLSFGLVWAARNFGASRHNFVVNRHRRNALSSFETFVKGASDTQTKDAVLLQATQSIFTPQNTGFVRDDHDSTPASQIIEVFRGMQSGKSQ